MLSMATFSLLGCAVFGRLLLNRLFLRSHPLPKRPIFSLSLPLHSLLLQQLYQVRLSLRSP